MIGLVEAGQSASAAGHVFRGSRSTAIKWAAHWRRTGEVPKATPRKRYRWRLDAHEAWLLALLSEEADLTLEQIRDRLAAERDATSCVNSLWRFYERHKISYKKTVLADEQKRPDVAVARRKWKAEQHRLDPERLIFLDATWVKSNMIRSRCPRGERLAGNAPFGRLSI